MSIVSNIVPISKQKIVQRKILFELLSSFALNKLLQSLSLDNQVWLLKLSAEP